MSTCKLCQDRIWGLARSDAMRNAGKAGYHSHPFIASKYKQKTALRQQVRALIAIKLIAFIKFIPRKVM
jgi:hypothetical protein